MKELYRRLGIKPVINAYEVVTLYGGSVMRPETLQAMQDAAGCFVDVLAFNRAVGRRLAELTRNEAAFVTAGCAAALTLSAAACLAGDDPKAREALPATEGRPNELVLHRCQRNPYDRALLLAGARLVEFGYPTHPAEESQLENAICERSAAVFYFAGGMFERYALPLEKVAAVAHERGLPVVVDAAAQLPPKENLWRYVERGADLVLFSGGKGLRGPQNTGLIVGSARLVEAIERIAAPHQAFGRPIKTSKECTAGLLRAVELFLEEDHGLRHAEMSRKLGELLGRFEGCRVFDRLYTLPSGRHGQQYPRGVFRLGAQAALSRDGFIGRLKAGDPAVLVGPLDEDDRAFYVNPFGLQNDEEYEAIEQAIRLVVAGLA